MNQVILVTGAARGIGFEIAQRFLLEGGWVAVNDCEPDHLSLTVKRLQAGAFERVLGIAADVSDSEQVNRMIDYVIDQFGQIDIVINNAGIYPSQSFLEIEEQQWNRVFDVNTKGVFLVSQYAAKKMIEKGIQGHIINISSGSHHIAREGSAHYCASKAAGIMLTKVMAMELARFGIRVNAVAPGFIEVDSMQVNPNYADATLNQIPSGRWGIPADIAEVVFHLATMNTDYITGAVIAVDGGLALGRFGIPRS